MENLMEEMELTEVRTLNPVIGVGLGVAIGVGLATLVKPVVRKLRTKLKKNDISEVVELVEEEI